MTVSIIGRRTTVLGLIKRIAIPKHIIGNKKAKKPVIKRVLSEHKAVPNNKGIRIINIKGEYIGRGVKVIVWPLNTKGGISGAIIQLIIEIRANVNPQNINAPTADAMVP